MYGRDFDFGTIWSVKLKFCFFAVTICGLFQVLLLYSFTNSHSVTSRSSSYSHIPSLSEQQPTVDIATRKESDNKDDGDCVLSSVNLLENEGFSDSDFTQTRTEIEAGESNSKGWWADGKKAFRVDGGSLQVTCSPKALGLYQYVQLKAPNLLKGYQISYKASLSNSTSTDTVGEGIENGVTKERFRGIATFLRGYNKNETILEFFQDEGLHTYTRNLPFKPFSIMVVIGCVGYKGWIQIDFVRLSPVSLKCEYVSRQDILGNHKHNCDCEETKPKPFSLQAVGVDNLKYGIRMVETNAPDDKVNDIVSLVTHATVDRLKTVAFALSQWGAESAATVAIYNEARNGSEDVLEKLESFLRGYGLSLNSLRSTRIIIVEANANELYPINAIRNIAINYTTTPYALLVDADIIPSSNCKQEITNILQSDFFKEERDKNALVIPVFEDNLAIHQESLFKAYIKRSRSKVNLKSLVKKRVFSIYKSNNQPRAHAATDYDRWWESSEPYQIEYESQYEPFVVVKVNNNPLLPHFDSRFVGYGWNKVSFIFDLHSAGFKFHVLPNSWLIHRTHQKTKYSLAFAASPTTRIKNRAIRFEWLIDNRNDVICR